MNATQCFDTFRQLDAASNFVIRHEADLQLGRVRAWLSDPRHGNTVVRTISEPLSESEAVALVASMLAEYKSRGRSVAAGRRTQRELDSE